MRKFALVLTLFSSMWLFACSSSSSYMYNTQDIGLKVDQSINEQQAAVIFYRADMVGLPDIATLTDNLSQPKIIAQLTSKAKYLYKTKPGTHYFGVYYDDIAHIIKADLKPGHYYYLKVTPNLDWMKPRFVFEDPASLSLQAITNDMKDTIWFEPKQNLETLNLQHRDFVSRQVKKGYLEWQESGKLEISKSFNLSEPLY